MKKDKAESEDFKELRKRAEALVAPWDKFASDISDNDNDIPRLIHELETHQVELKLQNEDLRKTLAELESSRKKYMELYDFAPVGYFTINTDGLILEANLAGADLLGTEKRYLIKRSFFLYIAHDFQDLFYQHRNQAFETRTSQSCELILLRKDRNKFHALLRTIAMKDPEENLSQLQIAVINIDELRETEKSLRETQAQLIQSAKLASLGELAAGVANELNQPLMVIRTTAQLALLNHRENDNDTYEELIKKFETIERHTTRMMDIIEHLHDFSRQSYGYSDKVNVNTVIKDAFLMINEQLRLGNINVKERLARKLPIVCGNSNQLEQVFLNMITNAKDAISEKRELKAKTIRQKAAFKGNIEITTRRSKTDKGFIEMLLKDNGGGIPADKARKIFDPFFSTKENGVGIGLSISYGIIRAHRGDIQVLETGPGGTIFCIRIPTDN